MQSTVWQVPLPSVRSGLASLVAVAGTGRLREMARHVAAGQALVAGSSEYLRGLDQGLATVRRWRP